MTGRVREVSGCLAWEMEGFWSVMDGGFAVNVGKSKESPYVCTRTGCFMPEAAPLGRLLPLDDIEDTLWDVRSGEIRF